MASDDSSSDGEDAEEELDAASMSFFMRLQNNIRDYEAHIGLLDALRNAGLPNALASARERFLEEFPLTEKMWNTWIDDVCSSAQSDGDIRLVETLFRRAQGDCMSPQLWLQHVDFVLARASESSREGDKVEVRALLEEAVTYVGVHVLDGAAMWARYLSFERAQLEKTRKQEGADVAVTIAAQFDRLVDIYCRQVSLPLRDNDASMSEARAWLAHEQPPPGSKFESAEAAMQALDLQHEKGAAALKVREPHENAIAHASFALDKAVAALATTAAATAAAATMATAEPGSATRDEVNNNNSSTEQAQTLSQGQQEAHARATHGHSLAEARVDSTWLAYVNFELETEGTDRAVALLERAVAAHPQRPALWLRGARLLRQHNRPAAHAWVARAVRSCWWSSKLWLEIMRSTELKAQSNPVNDVLAEVKSLADRALELGQATAEDYLQILLSVSICARRQAVQKLKDAGSRDAEALSYAYGVARKQISEVSKWASGFLSHSYPDWAVAALQLARQHAFAGQALLTELARSCCAAGQPGALILSEALSDGRALWEDVVTKHSTSLQPWLEYSRFEQTVDMLVLPLHKDGLEGRRCAEVFRRAVKHISDFPQAASEAWLQYAQQAGSLYDCEEAELHYEAIAQVEQANSQYGLHHKNLAKRNGNKHHRGMKRQRAAANSGDNKHESRLDYTCDNNICHFAAGLRY
eukprot:g966.t1